MEAVEGDTSSGASFFNAEYKKHGDLREMLDSSKDSLKLDAMKRIVSMMAKGRDVSDLFPQVVEEDLRLLSVDFCTAGGEECGKQEYRGEETSLCLPDSVRRGAAGPGSALDINLPGATATL